MVTAESRENWKTDAEVANFLLGRLSLLSVFTFIDGSSTDGAKDGRLSAVFQAKARVRSLHHGEFVKGGSGGQHRESEWPPRHPPRHHEQHYEHGHGYLPYGEASQRRQYSQHRSLSHAHPYPHTHNRSVNVDLSHTVSSPGGHEPYHTHPERVWRNRPRPHNQQSHYPLYPHRNLDQGRLRPWHYQEHSRQRVASHGARRISGAGWYPSTELTSEVTDTHRDRYHHTY